MPKKKQRMAITTNHKPPTMLTEEPKAEVSQRLEDLGKIYDEHNKLYGADYYEHGALMMALFPPHGITLTNESEFLRYNLFKQMAAKLARYANNFFKGGHKDSLDDIAVYSQMLAEIDGIIERKMKG